MERARARAMGSEREKERESDRDVYKICRWIWIGKWRMTGR